MYHVIISITVPDISKRPWLNKARKVKMQKLILSVCELFKFLIYLKYFESLH